MEKLTIELCPETGICSLVKDGANKTDLMPFEVEELKKISPNDIEKIKAVIAQGNETFAKNLTADDIKRILAQIA
ncbi:MAG: hypothetical protein Q7T18_07070 [Sedimentisphaerales bacterium]|nr:hypothetical protein [Sedimentisphaerales bacterium]